MFRSTDVHNGCKLIDVENGTLSLDLNDGRLFLIQCATEEVISAKTRFKNPIKVYYINDNTPNCTIKELRNLLKDLRR